MIRLFYRSLGECLVCDKLRYVHGEFPDGEEIKGFKELAIEV